MKKTLLLTLDFFPSVGGVSYYWMKLAEQLPADRLVVLAPPLPAGTKELSTNYRIIRKPFLSKWARPAWLVLVVNLWKVIRKEKPDVIIVGQILPVGTAMWLLSFVIKVPYIVSCHGMDIVQQTSSRKRWLMKLIFSRACMTIANSQYTGNAIKGFGVPSEKISYIYPCPVRVPQERNTLIAQSQKSSHTLLTVGRTVARKGHEYVIQAMPYVLKQFPDANYIILGDGAYRNTLESLVIQLGLKDHIRFLGALSDEQASEWYRKADVFIMAPVDLQGDVEGFGIVYLEASAFGLPVIATQSGGAAEAVLDGQTGIVVQQKEVSAIADAIITLFSNPTLARQLGVQGKERVQKEFQWKVQAQHLVNTIEQSRI